MSSKYGFNFEEVSVYANVVSLIARYAQEGSTHIDLGCGNAAIATALIERGIHYLGFDGDEETVGRLRQRGLEAYLINLNDTKQAVKEIFFRLGGRRTESLSMIDVLEHLDDGEEFLGAIAHESRIRNYFALILSVPNFAHADVFTKLASGIWDYTDTGLLDRTHRVIYTEDNLGKVTVSSGWLETASNDYHLEITEQRNLKGPDRYYASGGTESLIRKIKSQVDQQCSVYQFVRCFKVAAEAGFGGIQRRPLVSVWVGTLEDLECITTILENERFDQIARDKLQLILAPEIPRMSADKRLQSINTVHLEYGDSLEDSVTGRYFLKFSKRGGWTANIMGELIERAPESQSLRLVHAGQGVDSEDNFAAWIELVKLLNESSIEHVLLPCAYLKHYKEQALILEDFDQRSEQILRIAARAGVINLGIKMPLEENLNVYSRLGLIHLLDPEVIYQSFILQGSFPENLLNLEQKLTQQSQQLASQADLLRYVHSSISWKLTRPLRLVRRISRFNWRDRDLRREVVTKILDRIDRGVSTFRKAFVEKSFSHDNLKAIQQLSERRFNEDLADSFSSGQLCDWPMIDVSLVTFNSAQWIDRFFGSLEIQNYPLNKLCLTVVDHGSTDQTLEKLNFWLRALEQKSGHFEIITQANLGFGAGHHRAICMGQSDYCLVTNVDLEFPKDSLIKVVRAALRDKLKETASWEFRQIPFEHPKYYDPVTLETNWSSHACVLIRREAYEAVDGYDDRIFMYAEDVELSYRFRSYGYSLKYVPAAYVRHYTYEHAGEIKPLQFTGSILGNSYIRLRYGQMRDMLIGLSMYVSRCVGPQPFPGARMALLRKLPKLLLNYRHFLSGKGDAKAYFPLRGYDYEMIRDGAFWEIPEPVYSEKPLKVTIITRTYLGRGALLSQAIRSVFNQTYPEIELLIVEDGGDTQRALVESMAEKAPDNVFIRFMANPKLGRSAAGNVGLEQATGQFIMFLDDDDLIFADHVETLVAPMLRDSTISATYSLSFEVCTDISPDKNSYVEKYFSTNRIIYQEWNYKTLLDHNFIPIQAILFRRELYEKRGGFDMDLDQLEDWNLWLRYGYRNNFKFIPKTTSIYRIPADSTLQSDRHQALHDAYELAKSKAYQINRVGRE